MREILFRGKHTNTDEWIHGSLVLSGKNTLIYPNNGYGLQFVVPETVGQYTGMRDKNGVRIFEGDIVTGLFLFGMQIKSVVAFKEGAFGLEWNRGNVEEFSAFTSICNVVFEVIGNVHDNPELLEGE